MDACYDGCNVKYPCLSNCKSSFDTDKDLGGYNKCCDVCVGNVKGTHITQQSETCNSCMEYFTDMESEIMSADCDIEMKHKSALAGWCAHYSDKFTAFKQICSLSFEKACPAMKALLIEHSASIAKTLCKIVGSC